MKQVIKKPLQAKSSYSYTEIFTKTNCCQPKQLIHNHYQPETSYDALMSNSVLPSHGGNANVGAL